MDFGIASVAAITVIAYLVGIGCKAAGSVKDELIPVICGCVGAVLGIAGLYLMPDFRQRMSSMPLLSALCPVLQRLV
jgi:hypothetical protein